MLYDSDVEEEMMEYLLNIFFFERGIYSMITKTNGSTKLGPATSATEGPVWNGGKTQET